MLTSLERALRAARLAPAALLLAVTAAACNDDDMAGPEPARMYDQVQRLGNPLVSEVLLAKRNHPLHGTTGPAEDPGLIGAEVRAFITTVAGRSQALANTLAQVLLPDMLIVQTDKNPSTAGWLSWALANGWGGRKLADDVLDAAVAAVFGPLLDPNNVSPGLVTDNVANDSQFLPTFPYLANPN